MSPNVSGCCDGYDLVERHIAVIRPLIAQRLHGQSYLDTVAVVDLHRRIV